MAAMPGSADGSSALGEPLYPPWLRTATRRRR